MKAADHPRTPSASLLLAALAVIAVAGHFAGRQAARAGLFHSAGGSGSGPAEGGLSSEAPARPRPATVDRDRLASSLARMKTILRDCPDLALDWEAQAELTKLLGGLNSGELAEIFKTLDYARDGKLMTKIGAFWAARDPDAAMQAALAATEGSNAAAISIFGEWAQSQPAEALAWLGSTALPERLQEDKLSLYQQVLLGGGLLDRDFSLATGCIGKMKEKDAAQILSYWGNSYSSDATMRDQLIAFAKGSGRPMDYASLNAGLVSTWPQEDSVAMMNYLIGLRDYLGNQKMTPEVQREVDATAVGAAIFREYDGPALDWWMERHAKDTEVPEALASNLSGWMNRYPEKATAWFADQQPSPQLDALRSSWVSTLFERREFDKATAQVAQISDPQARQSAAAKLDYLWSATAPEAAAKWRAAQPELFPQGGESR